MEVSLWGSKSSRSSSQRKRRLQPLPAGRATQGKGWSLRLRHVLTQAQRFFDGGLMAVSALAGV